MSRFPLIIALVALGVHASAGAASAQVGILPDHVEEDWQVVLGTPDADGAGPQIATSMSPVSDNSTPFFTFDLNYRDYPSFAPGGMQVHIWTGKDLLTADGQGTQQCATTGEVITWTQSIRLNSGTVRFAVDSGKSTTWGRFGQGQQLNVTANFATALTTLSNYTPDTSVASSGVGWQRNRVASMTLVQVRYYAGGKLLSTDKTPRPINLTK